MANMNGQGPWWGAGPGTGRGMGCCDAAGRPFGFGRGRRFYGRQYLAPREEVEALEEEAEILEKDLAAVKERLEALKATK
jgi:hypothetical protein